MYASVSQTESCQRGFAGESESTETFAEITPDAHQESFFFFCLSGSWHQKAIWSLQNSVWHFTEWSAIFASLHSAKALCMRVCSLHAYTKLTKRQTCQDYVNWLHFNWIIYMIWLIKYSGIIGISIFAEKHPPNEDNSKTLSTITAVDESIE